MLAVGICSVYHVTSVIVKMCKSRTNTDRIWWAAKHQLRLFKLILWLFRANNLLVLIVWALVQTFKHFLTRQYIDVQSAAVVYFIDQSLTQFMTRNFEVFLTDMGMLEIHSASPIILLQCAYSPWPHFAFCRVFWKRCKSCSQVFLLMLQPCIQGASLFRHIKSESCYCVWESSYKRNWVWRYQSEVEFFP